MRRNPHPPDLAPALMTDVEIGRRDELMGLLRDARQAAATATDALATTRRRGLAISSLGRLEAALSALFDASLGAKSPGAAAGVDRLALAADERTGPGSVILRYFVEAGRTIVQAVSAGGSAFRALEVERPALLSAVYRFVETLRRGAPAETDARALYDALLAPVAAEVESAALIEIVADGALAALPFAALHDGEGYLVRRHAFAYRSGVPLRAGSAGLRRLSRARLFGVSKGFSGLPPLTRVPDELAGIVRMLPGARKWLNARFTADTLRRALADGADIVHVANHHHLVPGSPTRSFLLMGDGERLPVAAFFTGDYNWAGVGLVFLSGCETAAGDTTFEGGHTIAAAFHQAGVSQVVATVWSVADASASLISPRFYRELCEGASPAEALRLAQLALIEGDSTLSASARGAMVDSMAHPLHWAPFKLFVHGS